MHCGSHFFQRLVLFLGSQTKGQQVEETEKRKEIKKGEEEQKEYIAYFSSPHACALTLPVASSEKSKKDKKFKKQLKEAKKLVKSMDKAAKSSAKGGSAMVKPGSNKHLVKVKLSDKDYFLKSTEFRLWLQRWDTSQSRRGCTCLKLSLLCKYYLNKLLN